MHIELRRDSLWTKTQETESSFSWFRLARICANGDSVEFWFDPGLVVVRNRAFDTEDHKRAFVAAAERLGSREEV